VALLKSVRSQPSRIIAKPKPMTAATLAQASPTAKQARTTRDALHSRRPGASLSSPRPRHTTTARDNSSMRNVPP